MSRFTGFLQAEYHRYWVLLTAPITDEVTGVEDVQARTKKAWYALEVNPQIESQAVISGNKDGWEASLSGVVKSNSPFGAQMLAAPEFFVAWKQGFENGPSWTEIKVRQLKDEDE